MAVVASSRSHEYTYTTTLLWEYHNIASAHGVSWGPVGLLTLCHHRCEASLRLGFTPINGALTLFTVFFLLRITFDLLSCIYLLEVLLGIQGHGTSSPWPRRQALATVWRRCARSHPHEAVQWFVTRIDRVLAQHSGNKSKSAMRKSES